MSGEPQKKIIVYEYTRFLENLSDGTPFALARFNDGEMMGIRSPGCVVARGDQPVGSSLCIALGEAIQHQQKNYWVGLPCGLCFPEHRALANDFVDADYDYLTHAVVLTNRNWERCVGEFPFAIKERPVYWISGDDQDVSKLKFSIKKSYALPSQDSWSHYESKEAYYLNLADEFEEGSVVMISCGPLSRVLVKKWFEKHPNITFIDIGSTFDPFTRNVWHNCHKGWKETGFNLTQRCSECN